MRPKLTITAEVAEAIVADAGYAPEMPYPGGNKKPWSLRCTHCGTVKKRTLQSVRDGRECSGCHAHTYVQELRSYGYSPLADYPGVDASWRMRHDDCGTEGNRNLSALRGGSGCPCALRDTDRPRRSIVTPPKQAEAEARAAGYTPQEPYPGRASLDWALRCNNCGTTRPRKLKSIREGGHRCKECRYLNAEQAEALLAEHGYTPLEPYPGHKNARWSMRCDGCGWHKPRSLKRILQGHRCRSCMGWLVRCDDIEQRVRDAGFTPREPYPGRKDLPWECTCTGCNTTFSINTSNVCRGHRCGYCTGHWTDPEQAEADMLAKNLAPLVPYPGNAHTGWKSHCQRCDKVVYPWLSNIRSRTTTGCLYCARKAVDPADAEAFMHSKGWDPLEPYPGSPREAWKCRCRDCQKASEPSYKSAQRGHGCRYCNKQGFDYAGPGHVYVMSNTRRGAVKIGIFGTRARRSRPSIMRTDGWETHKVLACASGEEAHLIEQAVLNHVREHLGLRPYLSNADMPQNGATETFDAEQISPNELWELIDTESAARDEEANIDP